MSQRVSLEAAARELGVRLPVRVEVHPKSSRTAGTYMGVFDGEHRIALRLEGELPEAGSTHFAAGDPNGSLWHELTHALQCERDHDGDHVQFFHHYDAILARLVDIPKPAIEMNRRLVRSKVDTEMRKHGYSATLSAYRRHPMEAEAYANGERLGPEVDIEFVVSEPHEAGS